MRSALPLLSLYLCIASAEAKTKIKCHECWSPFGALDLPDECNEDKFCMGFWCTKGRDERANGVYHGCSDVAPVDERRPQCKDVVYRAGQRSHHTNCYCNNVEFCNGAPPAILSLPVLLLCFFFWLTQ
uniref:Protein quiver n=1 Tax=Steinernema glaseri TaxID=37863 RepID=A0A1I7YWT5_9BILA